MCKNRFPITNWMQCWSNKNYFDENDCNKNLLFSWTYLDLARTNETLESVHFIWWYFHETIKALCYVFEFKCSKVIRNQKPGLEPCLSYKILRTSLLRQQYHSLDLTSGPKVAIFQGRCTSPQKLNIIKLSLSFPCEIFLSLFLELVHMQFHNSGFICVKFSEMVISLFISVVLKLRIFC